MDIKTSIGVHDAFTEPLKNMTNALNMTISSFEKMEHVSGNAVDIKGLQQARNELAKAEVGFSKVGEEVKKSSKNQIGFNEEVQRTNRSAGDLFNTFRRVAMVIGFSKIFKDGFNVFREFNLEMATLEAVTLATRQEMEALHGTAKMMGETTIYSASQSAAAMTELAKGGLAVYEIVGSIPEVLNLSAASGMDLAKSAGITVDIMRGFNLEADQMGRVVDLIAYTSSNATTSVDLMGETFGYSAKIADTFNASIEETAALIGMMSSAAKGSKAGTALRSGFGRMADPTEDAQKWLDNLKISFIDPSTNELKSVEENIDNLAVAFKGLTDAQQIQAGKSIFGEQAYNAWLAVIQEGEGAMNRWLTEFDENAVGTAEKMKEIMLATTDGVLQLHKSEVEGIWISFYEGLADGVVGEAFNSVLQAMRTTLEIGLNLATGAFIVLGHTIQFLAENMDLLLPIAITLAAVWAILNIETLILAGTTLFNLGVQALQVIQYGLLVAWTMLQATATFFLTWATQGLSAALMATPLGWVIAGLVIIVGVVFFAVAAFNRLAGTTISAMGIIGGVIAVTGAFIANLFIGVFNVLWGVGAAVVNGAISLAEFLANVFTQPVSAIANLFVDMGNFILDIITGIANAIDAVFGSNLSGAVGTLQGNLNKWAGETFEKKKVEFDRVDAESPFDRVDYGGAWDSGYKIGDNVGKGISDAFKFDMPGVGDFGDFGDLADFGDIPDISKPGGISSPGKAGGLGDKLGGMDKALKDIAGNTKGIDDKMDITTEDLKYLRDLASNRIINRITRNEFNVQIQNENNIASELDLDGVITTMADGLEEQLNIASEGVS